MKKENNIRQYEIYCLYHNNVSRYYYGKYMDQITFVKMDKGPYVFNASKHIYLVKEPYFKEIGKEFAEYEFYYSLYSGYKNGLIDLPEYLGFIQYDMEFFSREKETDGISLIDFVSNKFEKNKIDKETLVSFQSIDFDKIYKQNIVMDINRTDVYSDPNFENCLDSIIRDYNFIKKDNIKLSDFDSKKISMCGSFLVHRNIFIEIMDFLAIIIEDKRLNKFNKKERMQGLLLERYLAIFLFGLRLKQINFNLPHHSMTGLKLSFINRIHRNIGKIGIYFKIKIPLLYCLLKKIK